MIVTLSGWAQPYDALHQLTPNATHIDYGTHADPDYPEEFLEDALKNTTTAIGWSLGGTLLMRSIKRGIVSPEKLVLIAAPAQFVRDEDFSHGMDELTFELFYENYSSDPSRTAKRFAGLIAKGDSKERDIIAGLDGSDDADKWHPWLDLLEEQRAEDSFDGFPPTLIIHGQQDAIVSHTQAEWLAQHLPNATLHSLPDAGHAPHLHDTDACASVIADFIGA